MSVQEFYDEVAWFFEPVLEAASSEEELIFFFQKFGYDLANADMNSVGSGFDSLANAVSALTENVPANGDGFDFDKLLDLFQLINATGSINEIVNYFNQGFFTEVFDYLLFRYLSMLKPGLYSVFSNLGVIEVEEVSGVRNLPYSKISFQWSRISEFVTETDVWAKELYGWNGNPGLGDPKSLDYKKIFVELSLLFESAGLSLALFEEISGPDLLGFLTNYDPSEEHYNLSLSVIQSDLDIVEENGAPVFNTEAGFKLLPYGDMNQLQNLGFALAPFLKGNATGVFELYENLDLTVEISASALGGIYLTITPGGISLKDGGEFNAGFETGLKYSDKANGTPIPILSIGDFVSLDTKAATISVGGSLEPDFFLKGGLDELTLKIDLSQDGLLGNFFDGPIEVSLGELKATWKVGKGVYFDGGNNVAISIPLHVDLGPLQIRKILIEIGLIEDTSVTLAVSGHFKLGPVTASVENVGGKVIIKQAQNNNGKLGKFDLDFGFKPPEGVGLSIDAGVVKGGGYLYIDSDRGEYSGALELTFNEFLSLKAIGLISTKMPDGSEGFSLLVIITAEFTIQLGFGFVFLGAGGLLGLHRTAKLTPLAEGVQSGATAKILFPTNVVENAPQIISDIRIFFPILQNHFLIGPMAKIGWGQPPIIDVALGIIIEIRTDNGGSIERIAILGVLKCILPDEDKVILKLQINFIGAIDFTTKYLFFFASIFDSRILFITIEGGMGLLVGWGNNSDFVLTVGGFHPRFNPPPLPFPVPKRLSINILNESWGKIRVSGYFAVTTNTVQFGAHLEVKFGFDAFRIEGSFGMDVLFQFDPFFFIVEISGKVSLKVFGAGVFSITLKFSLEGPTPWRAKGYGKIKILFFSFKARFDETWGERKETKLEPVRVMPMIVKELNNRQNWEAIAPLRRQILVSLRDIPEPAADQPNPIVLHPLGQIKITQRAVPLKSTIDKVGNQKPFDANRFDLVDLPESFDWGNDVMESFAPGQYFNKKASDLLSEKATRKYPGGKYVVARDSGFSSAKMTVRHVRYELQTIDTAYKRGKKRLYRLLAGLFRVFLRNNAAAKSTLSNRQLIAKQPFADKISALAGSYVVANTSNNTIYTAEAQFEHFSQAEAFIQTEIESNPTMAEQIHIIPASEAMTSAA